MTDRLPPTARDLDLPAEDYEDLYENAPCGYLSTHPGGRIAKINGTLANWLGYSADALIGKRFQDLLSIPGKIYYETHFAPLLRMQGFFNEVALDFVQADGARLPVLVNALERRNSRDEPLFVRITVFNATDRRRYERELLDARRQALAATEELQKLNDSLEQRIAAEVKQRLGAEDALRQSQKLESLGQLTGGVAHDFNNMLTVIMGGLERIGRQLERMPPSPEVAQIRRARDLARQGADRAAILTSRLLAFSRRQLLDPKHLKIDRLVANLSVLLQRTLGEAIVFEVHCQPDLWTARVDPHEFENALVNLAVNARDAMPGGGTLAIRMANVCLDDSNTASLPEPAPAGAYVLISVSDTGVGMDAETLARACEPFFTTKPAGKGTGLGLSQIYGFVRQSGGHLRLESEPGRGTTISIYLPRSEGSMEAAKSRELAGSPREGRNETILVVEDDEGVLAYSTEVLRELGYEVLQAATGPEALQVLNSRADVSLLFTDVVLPGGMNGRQLAEAARQNRPSLKVLLTTGYARDTHGAGAESGPELLNKPFTSGALAEKIRTVLESQ